MSHMGSDPRESLLQAAEKVTRLRRELAEAEREFDELRSGTSPKRTGGFPAKGTQVAGSVPARILERMTAEPTKAYAARDFQDLATGDHSLQYIRSSLYRLTKLKKLKKGGRGHFRLRMTSNGSLEESSAEKGTV